MIRIQLWSNLDETEFAIKLASDKVGFRASTGGDAVDYTKLADEIYEIESQVIDWPFMLGRWIVSWNEGYRHSSLPYYEQRPQQGEYKYREGQNPKSRHPQKRKQERSRRTKRPRRKSKHVKLSVQCRFCGLMFHNDLERAAHEKEWHQSKLKDRE
jgi:hypothetical protein